MHTTRYLHHRTSIYLSTSRINTTMQMAVFQVAAKQSNYSSIQTFIVYHTADQLRGRCLLNYQQLLVTMRYLRPYASLKTTLPHMLLGLIQ